MDLFLVGPMMHASGAKSRIVTRDVNQTPWNFEFDRSRWAGSAALAQFSGLIATCDSTLPGSASAAV